MTDIPVEEFGDYIDDLEKAFDKPIPESLDRCAEHLRRSVSDNFTRGGTPESAWPPRKDPKKKHPLLILSGDLYLAATSEFGRGAIEENDGRELSIGIDANEIPYAGAQNFGSSSRNLPPREFEVVNDEALSKCGQEIANGVLELLP